LAKRIGAPRTFIEFGFPPIEFNCAPLLGSYKGLLVDGNERQIADAGAILPKSVTVKQMFITRENLDFIADFFPEIGVLSIDVDGNDYWFLKELLPKRPSVVCVEYNASMLGHSVTVPYDPSFARADKHPSGWYHGASLTALSKLCAQGGYGLAAVSTDGLNAFFTTTVALPPNRHGGLTPYGTSGPAPPQRNSGRTSSRSHSRRSSRTD
jgi:hypothetical protein